MATSMNVLTTSILETLTRSKSKGNSKMLNFFWEMLTNDKDIRITLGTCQVML